MNRTIIHGGGASDAYPLDEQGRQVVVGWEAIGRAAGAVVDPEGFARAASAGDVPGVVALHVDAVGVLDAHQWLRVPTGEVCCPVETINTWRRLWGNAAAAWRG